MASEMPISYTNPLPQLQSEEESSSSSEQDEESGEEEGYKEESSSEQGEQSGEEEDSVVGEGKEKPKSPHAKPNPMLTKYLMLQSIQSVHLIPPQILEKKRRTRKGEMRTNQKILHIMLLHLI